MRTPHIHFDVQGRYQRLITQMYFPADDDMLKQDKVLNHDMEGHNNPLPAYIFGKVTPGASTAEKGADLCTFDIVLWNT
jgi:protocatechuate 3,4-dioxygenase beta subunit